MSDEELSEEISQVARESRIHLREIANRSMELHDKAGQPYPPHLTDLLEHLQRGEDPPAAPAQAAPHAASAPPPRAGEQASTSPPRPQLASEPQPAGGQAGKERAVRAAAFAIAVTAVVCCAAIAAIAAAQLDSSAKKSEGPPEIPQGQKAMIDLSRYELERILPAHQQRRIRYLLRSGRHAEAQLEAEAAALAAASKREQALAAARCDSGARTQTPSRRS
jgi:hypothetical protein